MEAPGLGRQMGIRVRLAGEGSCPQEACQVNPLELPTTEPEKSHIGYSLEPDSTRVSRQCLLNRCSWQKAVASTKSEREREISSWSVAEIINCLLNLDSSRKV